MHFEHEGHHDHEHTHHHHHDHDHEHHHHHHDHDHSCDASSCAACSGCGEHTPKEELVALMHQYAVEAYTNTVPAKKYVVDVIKQMKARGDSLNVLTASPHAALDPCLKRLGIFDLFDNVWSCEDFATSKADPKIYHMAAERIGAKVEDVLFLDDNYNADKTAKEAGMKVCAVYDDSSAEYEKEMREVADHYIYDFSELMAL